MIPYYRPPILHYRSPKFLVLFTFQSVIWNFLLKKIDLGSNFSKTIFKDYENVPTSGLRHFDNFYVKPKITPRRTAPPKGLFMCKRKIKSVNGLQRNRPYKIEKY